MVNNSGSYFLIQLGIFGYMLFKVSINMLARVFSDYRYARSMGIWAYEENYLVNFGRNTVKLFMESYFDIVFCACLNFWALI